MDIALRRALTVEEYLAWAQTERDTPRSELINGRVVALGPDRVEHAEVADGFEIVVERSRPGFGSIEFARELQGLEVNLGH